MEAQPKKKIPGKVVRVSYGLTVNTGNFENVRFDLTAEVAEDEKWPDVMDGLRSRCDRIKKRLLSDT
jgi:hypothetical protein